MYRTSKLIRVALGIRLMSSSRWLAVGQLTSTDSVENNFELCRKLIVEARQRNCAMICLPEAFDWLGGSVALAEPLDGPLMTRYRELARETGIWVSYGGFHEKAEAHPGKMFNTHVVVNAEGEIAGVYRKIHLFDVDIKSGPRLMESDSCVSGNEIVCVDTPLGRMGLTTCYDVRFPELYQRKLSARWELND
jgi:predicted amidohydrolase